MIRITEKPTINEINEAIDRKIDKAKELKELAEKFNADKTDLTNEIDKVKASQIAEEDKADLLVVLENAIEELQQKYESDVWEAQQRIQKELKDDIDTIEGTIEEYDQQIDSLKEVNIRVAPKDTEEVIRIAEDKKSEFDEARDRCFDELNSIEEEAKVLQKQIFRY